MNNPIDNYKLKIYFALDESGKLSMNDVCTHFIIGGFMYSDKDFVKSTIRKVESAIKKEFRISTNTEIKGSGFNENAIVNFINGVFDIAGKKIRPIFSVVDKNRLNENFTMSELLAYNFFVDNLFHFNAKKYSFTRYVKDVSILMDERNLKKDEENDLENLLRTIYIEKPYQITTYYMSSRNADVIRFADILDHVVYHFYNNTQGPKAKYFKENIRPEYLQWIKRGTIHYPFNQSHFDELEKIKNLKKKYKEDASKLINKLKSFSSSHENKK